MVVYIQKAKKGGFMKKSTGFISILIIGAVALIAIPNYNEVKNKNISTKEKVEATNNVDKTEESINNTKASVPNNFNFEDEMVKTLEESFDEKVMIKREKNVTMFIVKGKEGVALALASDTQDVKDSWGKITKNFTDMSKQASDIARSCNYPNAVSLAYGNDMNEENVLLVTMDGVVVLNAADNLK